VTGDFPDLFVGCRPSEDGRAVISSLLFVKSDGELTGTDLRRIPLARISAAVNEPHARGWVSAEAAKPDLIDRLHKKADEGHGSSRPRITARPILQRPPARADDEFYKKVAAAYRFHVERSDKPAVKIARDSDVPVATVRRWVNEARKRGHLGATEPGRAGG
jgi:hypothetical protein